jgi:inactivated superfamily I helicase
MAMSAHYLAGLFVLAALIIAAIGGYVLGAEKVDAARDDDWMDLADAVQEDDEPDPAFVRRLQIVTANEARTRRFER